MCIEDLYVKIQLQLDRQLPFVVYRKSGSNELCLFLQNNDQLYEVEDYLDSGFIFAPFDDSRKSILIPTDHSVRFSTQIPKQTEVYVKRALEEHKDALENINADSHHKQLVSQGVKAIRASSFKKIVLSRKEEVLKPDQLDSVHMFKRLIACYPNAFVYFWFHPKVGTWLGATPETLLSTFDSHFSTMSLAGTQSFVTDHVVTWGNKELDEQEIVTEFILNGLSSVSSNISSSDAYTHRAGALLHLRTDINGDLNTGIGVKDLIKILHPTPAVCGFPKNEAKSFIVKHEEYDRKFYTGFLGELNLSTNGKIESNLFVNLRCMELDENKAILYIGGGITKDSVPEKEWEETVRKAETMKRVLF